MTTPMSLLLWSILLGLLQCLATGFAVSATRGLDFSASARDDQEPLTGVAGRVIRAFANFRETFPFFVALVLASAVLHRDGGLVTTGAELYVWGRLIYWPLYVAGIPWIRSIIWLLASFGLVLMLIGLA
ncbi:MAPEG family protein [Acidisoma sp. 7E03]